MNDIEKFRDILNDFHTLSTGKPAPKRARVNKIRVLRSRVWLNHIFMKNKITLTEFNELIFYGQKKHSNTALLWLKGTHIPSSKNKVQKVHKEFSGSQFIYEFPVFALLEPEISRKTLKTLLDRYTSKLFPGMWAFPDTEENHPQTSNIKHTNPHR
jgi:hypothetical protein